MGFQDKLMHDCASKIIKNNIWPQLKNVIRENKPWYDDLQLYILEEWGRVSNIETHESQFSEEEEDEITYNAFHILMEEMNVDEDDYEDNEDKIDWGRWDEIVGYYICCL